MAGRMQNDRSKSSAKAANGRRRKRRRRSNRTLHFLVLIFFFLAIGTILSFTVLFKIQEVRVTGTDKYAPDEVAQASGIVLSENLLRIHKAEIEKKLLSQFPYIQSVQIKRKLPPAVELEITQCIPVGAIKTGDEVTLIDREGKVLEKGVIMLPAELLLIKGIDTAGVSPGAYLAESQSEKLVMLRYILDAIEESEFKNITNVDLTDRLNIRVMYENRILLELGSEADMIRKLQLIAYVLKNSIAPDAKGTLDASMVPQQSRVFFRNGNGKDEYISGEQPVTQAHTPQSSNHADEPLSPDEQVSN